MFAAAWAFSMLSIYGVSWLIFAPSFVNCWSKVSLIPDCWTFVCVPWAFHRSESEVANAR